MKNFFVFFLATAIFSFISSQDAAEEIPIVAVEEEEEDPFYKSPVNKLASSVSNFGYDFFKAQANKNPTSNLFMSPLTFAAALSAVSLGAGQRTESLIHRTLYYDLLNNPEVHTTYKELLASLSNGKGVKSIFRVIMERRLRMRADFVTQMEKFYGYKPRVLSGNSRIDLSEANDFVQKRADTKLGNVFKEMPTDISILLLGAAYFKGEWAYKFNPRETIQGKFYTENEQTFVLVPMMTLNNVPVRYGLDSDFNCRIMQLPLTGGVSVMFFLPLKISQNLNSIEDGLTSEFVHDIDRALQSVIIKLSMPKLKVQYEAELSESLKDIKLQTLFSTPDFSKISSKSLKLTHIVHKVALELNEDGKQDAPKVDPKDISHYPLEFHLDHPFLFVVRADDNGALLFIGKVMDPKGLSA